MKLEDLNLSQIDKERQSAVSSQVVAAISYAASLGYGPGTCHRFVSALRLLGYMGQPQKWQPVLRTVKNLQLDEQIKELESGRRVVGDIEP